MADSGRLSTGASIIGFVLLVNLLAAYVTTSIKSGQEATTTNTTYSPNSGLDGSCSTTRSGSSNVTTCQATGKSSFFAAVAGTTFTGFEGAPFIVNATWSLVMSLALTVAVLLIVSSFIPFLSK